MADKKEPPGKLSGRDEYGESGEGFEYKFHTPAYFTLSQKVNF